MRYLSSRCRALALALLLGGVLWGGRASVAGAQDQQVHVGLAAVPGLGLQAGYVQPRSFYTVEGVLYLDASPSFAGGQESAQVSLGLGGAIRIFGLLRILGSPGYTDRDVDVGLRFGPSLFFAVHETRADKNQQFSLFLEPYVRLTSKLGGTRLFFAEIGVQRPLLRAGIVFPL